MTEEAEQIDSALVEYWAKNGLKIQEEHPGQFLVLVAKSPVEEKYYTRREDAITNAAVWGLKALYFPLPPKKTKESPKNEFLRLLL